ncbi:MAG: protein kinase [Labilithrix sp.]|nr:protein kinase [Labilithrix sp.]
MALKERDGWEITTLGRGKQPDDRSGTVRALSLDPDRYAITDVLGEGGMGEVRRCRDSLLDRDVALKVVRPAAAVDDYEARFLREARVQARLAHPGVVPVYDVGRDANGRVYFTMKRVEGVTVEDVIVAKQEGHRTQYDLRRLLTAFSRACLIVDFAHARGVLHRDLKPANMMLGAYGEVYILDWGLAKVIGGDDELSASAVIDVVSPLALARERPTERGVAMGTPAYMSPEQAFAQVELDARTDVFALGAILYEILTLETLMDEEAIRALRHRRMPRIDPRPSARVRGLRDLRERVPCDSHGLEALDVVCARATALDRDERYPTARALHEAVEAYLAADEEAERRQRLAAAHVERARAFAAEVDRPAALQELGAALALQPDDEGARAHLVHLLANPPKVTPPEVKARRLQQEVARLRGMERIVALLYVLAWIVAFPIAALAGGVNDAGSALIVPAAWMLAALVTVAQRWMNLHDSAVSWSGVAGALAVAATSLVWGPAFIVPGLAIVVLFAQLLVAQKRQRAHVVFFMGAAVAVPSYLAMRGIFEVYAPVGPQAFVIHGAIGASRDVFFGGLLVAHLIQVLFGARFASRYRDILDARVLENALFSWQLANLVPRGTTKRSDDARRPSMTALEEASLSIAANDELLAPAEAPPIDADAPERHRYARIAHVGTTERTEIWRCFDRRLAREVDMHVAKTAEDDVASLAHARACGRLEHPAVAPLYDVGTNEQGRVYFTIKHVSGVTLDKAFALVTNERGLRRILGAFGQVCLALAYAHEQNVFHRALTPAHIVLGGFGEVYVGGWAGDASGAPEEAALDLRRLVLILGAILERAPIPELSVLSPKSAREIHEAIEGYLAGSRDDEIRTELAEGHFARAEEAAAIAFSGRAGFEVEAEARARALGEVGRAVRLAPGEKSAVRLLFRLLTEPPSHPPPAVVHEVERLREQRARGPARSSVIFGGIWLLLYPIIAALLGVRHLPSVIIVWSAWALAVGVLVGHLLRGPTRAPWPLISVMFAGLVTAALVGPFFFTPVIATYTTMSFVLTVPPGRRALTFVLGTLIVVVPVVLAWTGVYVPSDMVGSVLLSNGSLEASSHETTLLVLTTMHLLGILFTAEYAARFRDRLDSVETAYLLRAWQLTKLVRA